MIDLNSSLFFKAKFNMAPRFNDKDLLWDLISDIKYWMTSKWKKYGEVIPSQNKIWSMWKLGSQISSDNNIVSFYSVYYKKDESKQCWACKITESWPSRNGCAPREWITEIGFQQEQTEDAEVSIVIYYGDRPGFIGPCEPEPPASIPNLIPILYNDARIECRVGAIPLKLKPTLLRPGDFLKFWSFVSEKDRNIPIVYISPRRIDVTSDETKTLIDPKILADTLGSNALVYYSDTIDFSKEMTHMCIDSELGCYSGGVRVYTTHPNFDEKADSYRHRYINASYIIENGAESIYRILRRALAQDVHFYDTMFRVEDCKKLKDRAFTEQKMAKYREAVTDELIESTIERENNLKKKLEEIEEERFSWELEKEEFEERISNLKSDLYSTKSTIDAYFEEVSKSKSREQALDRIRKISKYPQAPEEVAAYFETHFVDRIAFTDKGHASLKECSTNLDILWDALYQMVTTLYELYINEKCPNIDQEFNSRSNFQMVRGEGSRTRENKKQIQQYQDVFNGREISIETHIRTKENQENDPRFLRIYFGFDPFSQKLVIGSCGVHKENYASQKIH